MVRHRYRLGDFVSALQCRWAKQSAQGRGVRFGRKPKLTVHQRQEALARKAAGEALVDIARTTP
jgi:hypothetical protein